MAATTDARSARAVLCTRIDSGAELPVEAGAREDDEHRAGCHARTTAAA